MDDVGFIKKALLLQGLPVYESDMQYIKSIYTHIKYTEAALNQFPYLNMEVPITVVDKRLMK